MALRLTQIFVLTTLIFSGVVMAEPRVEMSGAPAHPSQYKNVRYPWRTHITATVFWIGERPTARNPTPNHKSSWDQNWQKNFGGYDNPNKKHRAYDYSPKKFVPKLNIFYVALPYNDCLNYNTHKPEASKVIPWFKRSFTQAGKTVCRGRWVEIVYGRKRCYAQWEDCGPFVTDDWQYVFGGKRPKTKNNKSAGIDVSPAVRDYLGMKSGAKVHWRFIEFSQIPKGPWSRYGNNNPFVNPRVDPDRIAREKYRAFLNRKREALNRTKKAP